MAHGAKSTPPAAQTKKEDLRPLVLVWGDEYRVADKAKELVPKLCPPSEQALGLEVLDGAVETVDAVVSVVNKCVEAITTVGLFGASKTVWLREASFLSEAAPGRFVESKAAVARLTEEIKRGLLPGQKLLITTPKVDRRSAFFKAVQATGSVIELALPDKPYAAEADAASFLAGVVKEHGLSAPGDALDLILGKVGVNFRMLVQEVGKLSTYLGERRRFTAEDVDAIVSSSRAAQGWDLADMVGRRSLAGALRVFRQLMLQPRENPIGLVITLMSRLRELILFRACLDRRWCRLTGEAHWRKVEWSDAPDAEGVLNALPSDPRQLHPFRAGRLAEQASRFTAAELAECHHLAMESQERMIGEGVPADLVMEFYLIRILGGARRAAS